MSYLSVRSVITPPPPRVSSNLQLLQHCTTSQTMTDAKLSTKSESIIL